MFKKYNNFKDKTRKIIPHFSVHYIAYFLSFIFVVFSVIHFATATTPNPGHSWNEIGDGVFSVTYNQTAPRTYTFPDANATILTTNSAVTVAQGGTGLSTVAAGSVLGYNTANIATAITSTSGTKVLTNTDGTITWGAAPSSMVYPGAGIPNSTGSAWGTSYTTTGTGTVVALQTSPAFTTPSLGVATGTSLDLTGGNLDLDNTTFANQFGIITKNGSRFIHNFNYGNNGTVTTLGDNTFIGIEAGNLTMGSTATTASQSSFNTGIGRRALWQNTTGYGNSAFGANSLYTNSDGIYNSGIGAYALYSNEGGDYNFGLGVNSLRTNTTGNNNLAIGYDAGRYITDGTTANTTGDYNIFIGTDTKASADNDQNEIVIGYNTTGNGSNTATWGNTSILNHYFSGNLNATKLIGGSTTTSDLTLQTTSGVGATGADMHFLVGNNGATEAMTILNNGLVGINTTNPTSYLQVTDPNGTAGLWTPTYKPTLFITNSGTLNGYYSFGISNANGPTFAVTNAGNVGIGATVPVSQLNLKSESPVLTLQDNRSIGPWTGGELLGGVDIYTTDASVSGSRTGAGVIGGIRGYNTSTNNVPNTDLRFYTAAYTEMATERMRISETGNVGIGTTGPASLLHLSKTGGESELRIQSDTSNNATLNFTENANVDGIKLSYISASNRLDFIPRESSVDASPAMTILRTGGNVGIGITNPTSNLHVVNSNGQATFRLESTSATVGSRADMIFASSLGDTSLRFDAESTGVNYIQSRDYAGTANKPLYLTGHSGNTGSTLALNFANVGIGTTSPTYKLDVKGTTATSAIRSDIGFDIYPVPEPTTLTGAVSSGGSVNTGAHWYAVTFTTALGETRPKYVTSQITTTAGNNTVTLTIPTSTDPRVTGRKIYRTKAGEATYQEYYLASVADNSTTTYVDTIADSSLTGSVGVAYFRTNTTSNGLTVGGTKYFTLDPQSLSVGYLAGNAITTGGRNVMLGPNAGQSTTTGTNIVLVGSSAGLANTTGLNLTGMGYGALYYNSNATNNVGIGTDAIFYNSTGSGNTALGSFSLFGVTGNSHSGNTAVGYYTGYGITTGTNNVFMGYTAGYNNSTGAGNVYLGYQAGRYIADGATSNTTSDYSTLIGYNTKASADDAQNEIVVGYNAIGAGSNKAVIGGSTVTDVYFGSSTPNARLWSKGLTLSAGTATAGTAPLKLTAGTNLTTPEAGAIEWDGTNLFVTQTTGPTRNTIAYTSDIVAQVYPGAGIANSTGSSWGTSYTTTGSGSVVALQTSPSFTTPSLGVATATSINNLSLSQDNTDLNVKVGQDAGLNIVAGATYNTFLGYEAGKSDATLSTDSASENTAIGYRSLYSNTEGSSNTAIGYLSIFSNTQGGGNTAIGYKSLNYNLYGNTNTAVGFKSLFNNTIGEDNVANGAFSLQENITGNNNTANGNFSLYSNTTGSYNTANGHGSLLYSGQTLSAGSLITGLSYTIISTGSTDFTVCGAPDSNPDTVFTHNGTPCTGDGTASSNSNNNVALGYNSGTFLADGSTELNAPSNSLFIGTDTRASADGNTNENVIGYGAIGNGSNTVTIGNSSILRTYLRGVNLAAGTATAGTAPLKLTTGTALTTPEDGAIEYHNSHLYFTIGSTRYQLDQQSGGAGLTVGTSTITGGTNGRVLYNNSGVLGEMTTTGSGTVLALATTPTFTTNITTPLILGGSSTTQDLSFQTTSGVGATGADMHFLVGNNGATEAMTILNSGNVGIGTTGPSEKLSVIGDIGIQQGSKYQLESGSSSWNLGLVSSPTGAQILTNKATVYQVYNGINQGFMVRNHNNISLLEIQGSDGKTYINGNVGIGTTNPTSNFQVSQGTTGVGTISNTAGGTTVTGLGTQFTNTFKVGDTITIGGQTVAISNIASDTSMTTAAITNANTNASYTLAGGDRFMVKGNGRVALGTIGSLTNTFNVFGDARFGSIVTTTRYSEFDTSGRLTINYNDNANSNMITLRNLDITAGTTQYTGVLFQFAETGDATARNSGQIVFGKEQEWTTTASTNDSYFAVSTSLDRVLAERVRVTSAGNVGIGTTSPTAALHLKAGTATANTAPLKFTAGTNLTTPEAGAVEWDGTNLFVTQTTGPTRKTIAYTDSNISGTALKATNLVGGNSTTLLGSLPYQSDVDTTTLLSPNTTTTAKYLTMTGTGTNGAVPAWTTIPISIVNTSNLFSTGLIDAGNGVTSVAGSIFLSEGAGNAATGSSYSNFIGYYAGNNASAASYSNFFGRYSGDGATSANNSNFFGWYAGNSASAANNANFMGNASGYDADNASNSNMFGNNSGYQATNASYSNFLGYQAGYQALSASYSNLIGYQTGKFFTGNNIGSNNIIIGTNISLANATANSINLGGVIFAKNTYATTTGNPSITGTATGSVGIGVVPASISARLHLPAGTATAGTAPLKLTAGTNLTTPEAGAVEWDGTNLFVTQTTGPTRKTIAYTSDLSSYVPYTGATGAVNLGSNNLTIDTNTLFVDATNNKVLLGATSDASTSKLYISGSTSSNGSTTAIAGILGDYSFSNGGSANYVQVGNRFVVTNSPTINANTAVGEIIRMVDNTTLANLVRGIDITANAGSNYAGTNTGLRASGATFGIQGITTALAGGVSVPAAIYGESTGTTQGDILRLYSNSLTSAPSFATFYHDTSTFTGTGLLMDFATGSGTFSGNFADFQKNNTSLFKVTNAGIVSMGLSSTSSTTAVCSSLTTSTSPTAGVAYEIRDCSGTPVADYAEMYPVENDAEYGDIVVTGEEMVNTYDTTNGEIDWGKVKAKVPKLKKSNKSYDRRVVGIVSDNYGDFSSVGYNIKESDNPMPIALNGRVPVKISPDSSSIKIGDYVTTSSDIGKGMKATKAGFVIGKALESWDSSNPTEMIMIYVEQGYYNGDSMKDFVGISIDLAFGENEEVSIEDESKISGEEILLKLLENGSIIEENNISEIFVDRLVAGLEIITPRILTNMITVKNESTFDGLTYFNGESNFLNKVIFDSEVEFSLPPLYNSDTASFAIVKEGAKFVRITFDNPYVVAPVVTANISYDGEEGESNIDPEVFFEEDIKYLITEKSESGFTIILNKEAPFDVSFSWVALAVRDPKIFESVIEGIKIENNYENNLTFVEGEDNNQDLSSSNNEENIEINKNVEDSIIDNSILNIFEASDNDVDTNIIPEEQIKEVLEEDSIQDTQEGGFQEETNNEPVEEDII